METYAILFFHIKKLLLETNISEDFKKILDFESGSHFFTDLCFGGV